MERSVYEAEAENEETHWWFVGRRRMFGQIIQRLGVPANAAILDVGTSCGTNLRMLRDHGFSNVLGLDMSEEAVRFCRDKGLPEVRLGSVERMPFERDSFDLVLATDIIEHVDDDAGALAELYRVLRPGGHLLVTVPAFQSLWGFQDEVSHHKRRYRRGPLLELVRRAGFDALDSYHFNYLLFAPIWAARRAMRIWKPNIRSEGDVNNPLLNRVLGALFDLDVATAPRLRPPFGVSILLLARKPAAVATSKDAAA